MNWESLSEITSIIFLVYAIFLIGGYIFIGSYSIGELKKYLWKNSFTNYRLLANSSEAPPISIIAPAYNEAANIIENVRSLLSIYYNNIEVIIVNDGSKDNSLELLVNAYDLYKTNFLVNEQIKTKAVRGVYRSRNPIYKKLIVVDKENGGKADALNVGINISAHQYIVCIDVDCILEQDAILKLVKPFLETRNKRVIATGGVIRIANGCEVSNGRLIKVKLPDQILPRMQTLEYIRAFLLGRMAWSRLGGLLLISGAFGAFDKEIVIKCGGYDHNTVGEDMELLVRMRRYMEEQNLAYRIAFIPDPLCWTEAPATKEILIRQRNRWTRGTIETLYKHRIMFLNPKYGIIGILSFPYWFFFEMLAPLVEFAGFIFFLICAIFGILDYWYFLSLLLFVYTFGVLYSLFAILMEVLSYNQYRSQKDIFNLIATAFLEPIIFHPLGVWAAVRGTIDLIQKKNSWGEMTRAGFTKKEADAGNASEVVVKPIILKAEQPIRTDDLQYSARVFSSLALVYLLFLFVLSSLETFFYRTYENTQLPFFEHISFSFLNDLIFWSKSLIFLFITYFTIRYISQSVAKAFLIISVVLLLLLQSSLLIYYHQAGNLLGSDIFGYTISELKQTIGSAGGVSLLAIVLFLSGIISLVWILHIVSRKLIMPTFFAIILPVISMWTIFSGIQDEVPAPSFNTDFENSMVLNKTDYFITSSLEHFGIVKNNLYRDDSIGNAGSVFEYVDEKQFPFLHKDLNTDVLSSFLKPDSLPPNIVIILLEGLGSAYSGKGAYLGSFTPFIDSLANRGLYWENFLSHGGRTFAVLPAVLGSLPFGSNGFLAENPVPNHLSLISLLKHNGYHTSFYTGANIKFDGMDSYFISQGVDEMVGEKSFPAEYVKLPAVNGFSWGYSDKELFRFYLNEHANNESITPHLSVFLTVTNHNPFRFNEEERYRKVFEKHMSKLKFSESKKQDYRRYQYQYSSILYMDDAVRGFIEQYKKRDDYENTIFIISGDHRMPEIPQQTKIDRYHVPMIIYSPLITRPAHFPAVSSHNDITPSLLSYLKNNHNIAIPTLSTWIGEGLDTSSTMNNQRFFPIMQSKTELKDFVLGDHHLSGNALFKLYPSLDEERVQDLPLQSRLISRAIDFRTRNSKINSGKSLVPDSIFFKYSGQRKEGVKSNPPN